MSSTTVTLRQSFEKRFVNPKQLRPPGFESIELLEDCSNRDTAANRREFERRMKLRAWTRAIPIDGGCQMEVYRSANGATLLSYNPDDAQAETRPQIKPLLLAQVTCGGAVRWIHAFEVNERVVEHETPGE